MKTEKQLNEKRDDINTLPSPSYPRLTIRAMLTLTPSSYALFLRPGAQGIRTTILLAPGRENTPGGSKDHRKDEMEILSLPMQT